MGEWHSCGQGGSIWERRYTDRLVGHVVPCQFPGPRPGPEYVYLLDGIVIGSSADLDRARALTDIAARGAPKKFRG